MYNWKPKNKKAQKLWNKRIEESKDNIKWGKDMWKEYGGLDLENEDFNDSRKIVYMTDNMYVTKDGIVLQEEDSEILNF
jgi:aminoglycoside N3'-acetyltransferase